MSIRELSSILFFLFLNSFQRNLWFNHIANSLRVGNKHYKNINRNNMNAQWQMPKLKFTLSRF